jgi:hypothetical protein
MIKRGHCEKRWLLFFFFKFSRKEYRLMFNPFFARPIGSDRFERHLITQMLLAEERKNMERDAIPEIRLILHGVSTVSIDNDPVDEGYKALSAAVFAKALSDYLLMYAYKLHFHDDNDPEEWVYFSDA